MNNQINGIYKTLHITNRASHNFLSIPAFYMLFVALSPEQLQVKAYLSDMVDVVA